MSNPGERPSRRGFGPRTRGRELALKYLDAADVAARLSDRAKVLMPVHYAGVAPDMDRLGALARNREVRLVEDAWDRLNPVALKDQHTTEVHEKVRVRTSNVRTTTRRVEYRRAVVMVP